MLFVFLVSFQYYQLSNLDASNSISRFLQTKTKESVGQELPVTIVVPDLHGDFNSTVKLLKFAGVIDDGLDWIAPPHVFFVCLGDVFDRGAEVKKILTLIKKLKRQSHQNWAQLIGNHDWLNLFSKSYEYVHKEDWESFGGKEARERELSMEGELGRFLRSQTQVALVKHDTLFAHAGLNPSFIEKFGIPKINELVSRLLQGENQLWKEANSILSGDGPWWTRNFAVKEDSSMKEICKRVNTVLEMTGTKRMMIGHNKLVDKENLKGKVSVSCDQKLWGLDVGISSVYGGPMKFVRIEGDNVQIIERKLPQEIQLCLDQCEDMCCGTNHHGSWMRPTCAMGCFAAFDESSLSKCKEKCQFILENKDCDWQFQEARFNVCKDCGCKPEDGSCEIGCRSFFDMKDD